MRELVPDAPKPDSTRFDQMSAALDRLLQGHDIDAPAPPAQADEDRLAAFGYLRGLRSAPVAPSDAPLAPLAPSDAPVAPVAPVPPTLNADEQAALTASHRHATELIAQKKYSAALDALRAIAAKHPALA